MDSLQLLIARNRQREELFRIRDNLKSGRTVQPPRRRGRPARRSRVQRGTLEQRRATRSTLRGVRQTREILPEFEFRTAGNGALVFTGYGAVFEATYTIPDLFGEFVESVDRGAFRKTLAERCDTIFDVGHSFDSIPLARTSNSTMLLAEDSTGLHVEARLDATRQDVRTVRAAVEREDLTGLSIGFVCVTDRWNENGPDPYTRRHLVEISLDGGDVALVAHPASTATIGSASISTGSKPAMTSASTAALVARNRARERRILAEVRSAR